MARVASPVAAMAAVVVVVVVVVAVVPAKVVVLTVVAIKGEGGSRVDAQNVTTSYLRFSM